MTSARQMLQQPGIAQELESCPKELLTELAFTFAAFQPAILDEGLKGEPAGAAAKQDRRGGSRKGRHVYACRQQGGMGLCVMHGCLARGRLGVVAERC